MTWVAANIGQYGGDPGRIAMIGDSAGGNLVINAAFMANQRALRSSCVGKLPHVSAVVALYPVIDVAEFYRHNGNAYSSTARDITIAYTGGTPSQFPERYAYVSSPAHLSPAAPATVLMVGDSDTLVPPSSAYAFARMARNKGVNVQLITVPYAGHSFDILSGSINNQLTRNATLRLMTAQRLTP